MAAEGDTHGHCYGCGWHGDAVEFVRALHPDLSFPDVIRTLTGENPAVQPRPAARVAKPKRSEEPGPASMIRDEAEALGVVEHAEAELWTDRGQKALEWLLARGLSDATIRQARLGYVAPMALKGSPRGISIPWFDEDGRLALVKIRQPDGRNPKYREAYRNGPTLYPDPDAVEPGRPVILCEGELDALLLCQELDGAAVGTLGGASVKWSVEILSLLLPASAWLIATDADEAGDKRALEWMKLGARCRRVRPPDKDWTDTHRGGCNRIRYHFGRELRLGSTWSELESQRWGPALLEESDPCLNVDEPDDVLAQETRLEAEARRRFGTQTPK